jgi:hypothetical protein
MGNYCLMGTISALKDKKGSEVIIVTQQYDYANDSELCT